MAEQDFDGVARAAWDAGESADGREAIEAVGSGLWALFGRSYDDGDAATKARIKRLYDRTDTLNEIRADEVQQLTMLASTMANLLLAIAAQGQERLARRSMVAGLTLVAGLAYCLGQRSEGQADGSRPERDRDNA